MNKANTTSTMDLNDGEPVSRKVADALHERLDQAAEKGERFERALHEKSAKAHDKAREMGAEVGEKTRELNGEFARMARENPWAVAGGAVALGFVIGLLTRGR